MSEKDFWAAAGRWIREETSPPGASGRSLASMAIGAILGATVQIGPALVAGFLGLNYWWAIAWGAAVAVPWKKIGRTARSFSDARRRRAPHWLSGILVGLPMALLIFVPLNLAAYWVAHLLAGRFA